MTQEEFNDLKTFCCGAKYIRIRRATWICDDCKKDRSMEIIMLFDAIEKSDAIEKEGKE